jgi:hypothetical protein
MTPPLVSIVINSYNYGRFLGGAIESALAQTYPHTEVIVVDDGSTDSSRAVIASYAKRIIPILQENSGQAAALNAGFERSRGALILFLDADDMLHPQIVATTVDVFRHDPQVVRVQYRLALIDAEGAPTGETTPPHRRPIAHGDLARSVFAYGDDIAWLPTSGNMFTAAMLRRIFPIPVSAYRICADYYLSNLSPLYGRVAAVETVGGYYRVHAANRHYVAWLDPERTRQNIVRTVYTHTQVQAAAHRLGLTGASSGRVAALSVTFPANRLVSLRLDPARHPLPSDTRFGLARRGIWAAWRRPDLALSARMMYTVWFTALACVPSVGAAAWLAEQLFYPGASGLRLRAWLANQRGSRPVLAHKRGAGE